MANTQMEKMSQARPKISAGDDPEGVVNVSYIIVASFFDESEKVSRNAVADLLKEPKIRLLSRLTGETKVDIPGDHMMTAELTLFLCQKLIESGVYEFTIGHSY